MQIVRKDFVCHMISSSPTLLRDADCLELVCQDFLLDYYVIVNLR